MGSLRPALLAIVAGLLVLWSLFPPAFGQNPSGHMVVTPDYELFGTSDLNGGGHVTWTLTGAKRADLRANILHMYNGKPPIPCSVMVQSHFSRGNRDSDLRAVRSR